MELYHYFPGTIPVIVSIPHAGTFVPKTILDRLLPEATSLPDTDWHVDQLYAFVKTIGVHLLIATHSRYVIDLNRSADDYSLYPGKFTTSLCPTTQFDGSPLYTIDQVPDAIETKERIKLYWQPYHQKLQQIITELKKNSKVIVFDAHSIKSQIPLLFDGVLPDLNLGTADGISCESSLVNEITEYCRGIEYSFVCNGRFKGGYITRHYGDPKNNVSAIQLELAQKNYMQETSPYDYLPDKAKHLQKMLSDIFFIITSGKYF